MTYQVSTQPSPLSPSALRSYVIVAGLLGSVVAFLYALFVGVPSFARSKQIPIEEALGFTPPSEAKVVGAYKVEGGYIAEISTRDPAQKITILRAPQLERAPLATVDILDALRKEKNVPTSKPEAKPVPVKKMFVDYLGAHLDMRRVSIIRDSIPVRFGSSMADGAQFTERDRLHFLLTAHSFSGQQVVTLITRSGEPATTDAPVVKAVLESVKDIDRQ